MDKEYQRNGGFRFALHSDVLVGGLNSRVQFVSVNFDVLEDVSADVITAEQIEMSIESENLKSVEAVPLEVADPIRAAYVNERYEELKNVVEGINATYAKLSNFTSKYPIDDVHTGSLNEPILHLLLVEMINLVAHSAVLVGDLEPQRVLLEMIGLHGDQGVSSELNNYISDTFLKEGERKTEILEAYEHGLTNYYAEEEVIVSEEDVYGKKFAEGEVIDALGWYATHRDNHPKKRGALSELIDEINSVAGKMFDYLRENDVDGYAGRETKESWIHIEGCELGCCFTMKSTLKKHQRKNDDAANDRAKRANEEYGLAQELHSAEIRIPDFEVDIYEDAIPF